MNYDPFEDYIKQTEPDKKYKAYAWSTAIGLQAVDGLTPSEQLYKTAIDNIEGNISMADAVKRIESYYAAKPQKADDNRTEEADNVSARIAEILSEKSFSFAPSEYIGIHKKLFSGIYKHAGQIRDYNITKEEWVLNGETILYGNAAELRETLEYDFAQERKFSYKGLSTDEIIHHLAYFISRLWQIHIFGEGNTRTTAVFFIKYLRSLGYDATNDIFAKNAWYFRNALVRANYTNLKKNIHETTVYLEAFIRNLLLGENNELKNRYLHIDNIIKKDEDINAEINEGINAGIKLSDKQLKIIAVLKKNPYCTIKDLSETLEINHSTVERNIKKLRDNGIIERVGARKDGHWVVKC
ncbi:MAG: Fic family protein [Clostridia bacterium]|nr:Fic family protein [Clostridia bacterium]